jgi:hypothetical protein
VPALAREAQTVAALHDHGYRFCHPPTLRNLSPREQKLLLLADRAETYIKQQQRNDTDPETRDRPDNFGDVGASRRRAFQ